jgi:hypothetical protein
MKVGRDGHDAVNLEKEFLAESYSHKNCNLASLFAM